VTRKKHKTIAQSLAQIEETLKRGKKLPVITQPLPGLFSLLRDYNLEPGIDIFIPWINKDVTREQFRWRLKYRKQRDMLADPNGIKRKRIPLETRLRDQSELALLDLLQRTEPSKSGGRKKSG